MPAKADKNLQKSFLSETLLPAIEQAKSGLCELFFLDASHFVMGGFAGRVWCKVRVWIKTACGRQRYNVLGALNYVTKEMTTIVNNTYITSTQVVEMLDKLKAKYTGKVIKIILDNAAYQRCGFVRDYAKSIGIELLFLPTYSPNLNLIERVWKFVKSQVLNAEYSETFTVFCEKINSCIDNLHTIFADKMSTLITEKFQILET